MNAKKIAPLIAAIALGLVAAYLATKVAAKKPMAVLAAPRMPNIVVAKTNVAAGEALTGDNVQATPVAAESVPAEAFRDPTEVAGRVAKTSLVAGQAILAPLVTEKNVPSGLQAVIRPGMRAVTLEINEITGVAGYITAGCHVDVIQTMRDDQSGEAVARAVVQDVPVTAVGPRRLPTADATPDAAVAHSVTLMVTPEQSEMLDLASKNGTPRLTLRSAGDTTSGSDAGVTLADLRGHGRNPTDPFASTKTVAAVAPATTQPADAAAKDQWVVRIVRGGAESQVRFDVRPPVLPPVPTDPVTQSDMDPAGP